jgi:hypothetical protein
VSASRLRPVPLLEEVVDWVAKAWQQRFTVEVGPGSEQCALRQRVADVAVVRIVLGAHDQFSVDQFMEVAVVWQWLQFGFGRGLVG